MEIQPECVPCLLKRCLYETRLVDPEKEREVMTEALRLLNELYEEGAVSAEVATVVHGRVYDILETKDPYAEMKESSNKAAERLLPRAREEASKALKEAMIVSIAGNVLDFGFRDDIDSADYLVEQFEDILEEGLGYDDVDKIEELLKKGGEVIFFTDNTGEIVFDKLLLEKINEYDVQLTVVVKGEPVLTDATMEDALRYEIDRVADDVKTTGAFAIGVDFDELPEDVMDKLERADLIIAKGMANWESFSETDFKPIAHLTRSKCGPVAKTMKVPEEANVVKLFG